VGAAWEQAVSAGAEVIYPLAGQLYGERGGRVRDPFGQQWMMSQHVEDVPADEMARRAVSSAGNGQQPPARTWPVATHRSQTYR
jgi:hypothetical protein